MIESHSKVDLFPIAQKGVVSRSAYSRHEKVCFAGQPRFVRPRCVSVDPLVVHDEVVHRHHQPHLSVKKGRMAANSIFIVGARSFSRVARVGYT